MEPVPGLADWEVTQKLSNALGYKMNYAHPKEIMQEISSLTPTFMLVMKKLINILVYSGHVMIQLMKLVQKLCTLISLLEEKVNFITKYVASDEKVNSKFPLILATGRILSQYNVGAQTRRTENLCGIMKTVLIFIQLKIRY